MLNIINKQKKNKCKNTNYDWKIFKNLLNNFINNEQILSTLIENNEGDNEDSVKYNGNVGLILPPAKYIYKRNKWQKEMILLNPCNLLHSNDNYFNSKDLKFRSSIDNPHFITKIVMQNHGIKSMELWIINENDSYKLCVMTAIVHVFLVFFMFPVCVYICGLIYFVAFEI